MGSRLWQQHSVVANRRLFRCRRGSRNWTGWIAQGARSPRCPRFAFTEHWLQTCPLDAAEHRRPGVDGRRPRPCLADYRPWPLVAESRRQCLCEVLAFDGTDRDRRGWRPCVALGDAGFTCSLLCRRWTHLGNIQHRPVTADFGDALCRLSPRLGRRCARQHLSYSRRWAIVATSAWRREACCVLGCLCRHDRTSCRAYCATLGR